MISLASPIFMLLLYPRLSLSIFTIRWSLFSLRHSTRFAYCRCHHPPYGSELSLDRRGLVSHESPKKKLRASSFKKPSSAYRTSKSNVEKHSSHAFHKVNPRLLKSCQKRWMLERIHGGWRIRVRLRPFPDHIFEARNFLRSQYTFTWHYTCRHSINNQAPDIPIKQI